MKIYKNYFIMGILVSIMVVSIIGVFVLTPSLNLNGSIFKYNQPMQQYDDIGLKSANNGRIPLNYSSFYQNVTSLNRLFESIYFSVNVSGFKAANSTIMQISYQEIFFRNFSMSKFNDDEFEYTYTPEYDAKIGFYRVNFFIFNQTNYLLNTQTTYFNFTITSNYVSKIGSPNYIRRELADGEFKILNYGLHTFIWTFSIVDSNNESLQDTLFTLGSNVDYFFFELNDSFTESSKMYYVKITVTDTFYNEIKPIYLPFTLLNSIPQIIVNSVSFSDNNVKRNEDCTVSLNVTDGDKDIDTFPDNISVYIILQDSNGIKGSPLLMINNDDWTFNLTFSIAINKPIGIYQVIFEVHDQFDVNSSYITTLIVENNLPKIHGFIVNDLSIGQSISINYGEDIRFKFNVSDVENTIAFIIVQLLNERNEWYNISIRYSENIELIVRTVDLISGSWYIYLTVIDEDGGITTLTSDYGYAPKEIRIIPDVLNPILPWIGLVIGVIFGFLGGIALVYKYFKSKYKDPQELVSKKKKSKQQEIKPQPIKEEVKKEELEKKDSEQETTEKKPLQRKIKRRLK